MDPPRHAVAGRRAAAEAGRRRGSSPRRRRAAPGARARGACGSRSTWRPAPTGRGASRPARARSCAASRLKVTTQIRAGATPRARSTARRATIVVVLPLPAGAMIWAGPSGSVAAARCSGSSASRIGPRSSRVGVGDGGPSADRVAAAAYRRITGGLSVTARRAGRQRASPILSPPSDDHPSRSMRSV